MVTQPAKVIIKEDMLIREVIKSRTSTHKLSPQTAPIVGSDLSGPAQDVWDFRPTSSVQRICREWAKELGFGVWTTVIMVFYSIG